MADLLECLIQMKGVADTPRRLAERVDACVRAGRLTTALDVASSLARAEERFGECLSALLRGDGGAVASLSPPAAGPGDEQRSLAGWLDAFRRRRADVVRVLDRCTAEDLGRAGVEPTRGRMTVADLVATMLAHDTDQLGRLL